jgi:hypothetical protein
LRKKVLSDLKSPERVESQSDVFVASFSSNGDSLPQWRGYCSIGSGVSIGFRSSSLLGSVLEVDDEVFKEDDDGGISRGLMKCAYTDNEKRNILSQQLDSYISIARGTHPYLKPNRSRTILSSVVDLCSPSFKHESFKEEEEWREVVDCQYPQIPKRHFRPGLSTLVPYITLDVAAKNPSKYISHVFIAPTPHEELARMAVEKLLRSRGLDGVKVENSANPYRSW